MEFPSRVRVKICGLTRPEDVDAAVAAGADAVGFVFVPGTPRAVTPSAAVPLRRRVPPFVSTVGLFVDERLETIRATVQCLGLDVVQLHGDESPQLVAECSAFVRVVKALRVRGPETLERMGAYAEAGAILLDAFVPGAHGGTGARFDWDLAIKAVGSGRPVILAGGLTPGNAAEAARRVQPYALDVSSGVESSPGIKDPKKIREFLEAVAAARA